MAAPRSGKTLERTLPSGGAGDRSQRILDDIADRVVDLPPRFARQAVHLTAPANVWKYVQGAVEKSDAPLVMIDLEDAFPEGDDATIRHGRDEVVRALATLDWKDKLRFFRPRGTAIDPEHDDIASVVMRAGARLDGIIVPKVEHPDEIRSIDMTLAHLEARAELEEGKIRLGVLVESAAGEEAAFDIARASKRVCCLILGAFDYWSSLRMGLVRFRFDHPAVDEARVRIVKAAASVGVPAIAEMTTNFPTSDKSPELRAAALEEFRRDALHAKDLGMVGKWAGIPAQVAVGLEVFTPREEDLAWARRQVDAFRAAEAAGRASAMVDGHMADRATYRMALTILHAAGITDG